MLPQRIVCLTEETTETLYLLGEEARIVGISGFTVRPPRARREKPKVSAFTSARIALDPDLVLGFSDLQADIAAALIRHSLSVHMFNQSVHVFNQRTVAGILDMIGLLGAMIGATAKTATLIAGLQDGLGAIAGSAAGLPRRPCVYFEEWDAPLIAGIGWVSELIEIAGARNCFSDRSKQPAAKGRIIADPNEVVRRAPDIIIGSWCGKRFRPEQVKRRPAWDAIPAVRDGEVHEIKSADILQPGPAALTDGLRQLHGIVARWAARAT